MKKIVLFLFTLSAVFFSCDKQIKQPLNYSVTNDALQNGVFDVYIPDTGTYDMPVLVKFLSGYVGDKVTLRLTGLPDNVTVTPDTVTAAPTFTHHFIFKTSKVTLGNHQLTLTASSPGLVDKVFNFNIIVLPANSAALFAGKDRASNSCKVDYMYDVTCTLSDTINILYINNFGGYGTEVTARVLFDEQKGTLTLPRQLVGNGTTLYGDGTFTLTTMTINYFAISTPGGPADQCKVVFVK